MRCYLPDWLLNFQNKLIRKSYFYIIFSVFRIVLNVSLCKTFTNFIQFCQTDYLYDNWWENINLHYISNFIQKGILGNTNRDEWIFQISTTFLENVPSVPYLLYRCFLKHSTPTNTIKPPLDVKGVHMPN